ncbi:MAG: ECF transporter S component [Clostridia bacterium]|nr:ECF transporter S component [Clostridia bacterium]
MDKKVKMIVFTGVLSALVILLQVFLGIPFGPFSITLALFPIVVGAVVLGPVQGLILGLVFGIVVSILSVTGKDPGGQMVFAANPFMAWILCLLKGAMAGFLSGIIYKVIRKFKYLAELAYALTGATIFAGGYAVAKIMGNVESRAARIIVPIVFALVSAGLLIALHKMFKSGIAACYIASMIAPVANTGIFIIGMLLFFRPVLQAWAGGSDVLIYVLSGLVGMNFIIEFFVSVALSPAVAAINKYAGTKL